MLNLRLGGGHDIIIHIDRRSSEVIRSSRQVPSVDNFASSMIGNLGQPVEYWGHDSEDDLDRKRKRKQDYGPYIDAMELDSLPPTRIVRVLEVERRS